MMNPILTKSPDETSTNSNTMDNQANAQTPSTTTMTSTATSMLPPQRTDIRTTSSSVESSPSPAKSLPPTYSKGQIILYMLIFFFMMIAHEVALEAASTSFHHLESLASTVTLFQFGFCFLLPLMTSTKEVCRTFPKSWKATLPYVQLSLLVFGATGLATQSLKYVSYPTKVVFKSAKLIPTMIISTCIFRGTNKKKKYGPLDYLAAFLLCIGAAGYSYNSGRSDEDKQTSLYGISLLLVSIVCDAFLPNLQEKLMSSHYTNQWLLLHLTHQNANADKQMSTNINNGLSAQAIMVNTNAIGFGTILIYMFLSGSLAEAIATAMINPKLLFYLICVGVGLSTSVLAYTKLIQASGSVIAVAVSTLRKVATVLLSYILFPKPILSIHVFSGILVLAGVLIGTFCRKR